MSKKKPLIILTGPTAVGKTELSIQLAKHIGGEIISADSMQVYKRMDIGSAKIKPEEMCEVKHYMIDILEPTDSFHVVMFKELALKYMEQIYANGHIPIIVGGTGFYIQALLYDIDFTESDQDEKLRGKYELLAKEKGNTYLFELLRKVDPESCNIIHENNVKRVIRALEFYDQTGEPISKHNEEQRQNESPYNFCYFVLTNHRDAIYERIEKRVDIMIEDGLLQEVKDLLDEGCTGDMVSMQGLGYKQLAKYLNGEISYEQAVYEIKRDTRHFAKRQLTWFKREKDVTWVDKSKYENKMDLLEHMLTILRERKVFESNE